MTDEDIDTVQRVQVTGSRTHRLSTKEHMLKPSCLNRPRLFLLGSLRVGALGGLLSSHQQSSLPVGARGWPHQAAGPGDVSLRDKKVIHRSSLPDIRPSSFWTYDLGLQTSWAMSTVLVGLLPGPAGNKGQLPPPQHTHRGPDPVESTHLCIQTTPTPSSQARLGEEGQVVVQRTLRAGLLPVNH